MNDYTHSSNISNIKEILGNNIYNKTIQAVSPGYNACFIKTPKNTIPQETQERIYNAYIPLTTYAFGADMTSYWESRKANGYMENLEELVLVSDTNNNLVGWTGYCLLHSPKSIIVYNDSSGMTPFHQKKGIMSILLKRRTYECIQRFNDLNKPVFFATRTESPIIYSMRLRLTKKLYPNPNYQTPDFVKKQALFLSKWLGQSKNFDENSLIIRDAYAMVDNLYGELPTSGDANLDAWISKQVGPLDAFLLMGEGKL